MSNSDFKRTSRGIQNDLISRITEILNEQIMNELNKAKLVFIQADKTTDIKSKVANDYYPKIRSRSKH